MFDADDYLNANEDDERYFFRDHRERPMSRRELWMATQDHTPVSGNCAFCGAQIEAPRSVVMASCGCGRYTAIRSLLAAQDESLDGCEDDMPDWHDISAPSDAGEVAALLEGAPMAMTATW